MFNFLILMVIVYCFCLISSAARLLFQFDYVHLFHDSAIQASLMALAAPSIDITTAVQGECRTELARAMLSRSPQSPLSSQLQLQS